ncbi:hypothetical protein HBI25_217860 [Parastagonospora nodorum]|nr:hypothetical protein HBH52_226540 [Parastagonospora nodorum]KAH4800457.1 hypothetical protein HBH61_211700 [Parastagonospora nodorum]KAH5090580.1 hypothetical protein HBH72_215090 [Parastagonospora nodorum]KAH5142546.1 hypothetical protein HBH69_198720 [Parastagonospora nodorum]KAH5411115.1 hypothetical protein HBI32_135630 [Parastagonospora nodorum]
MPTPSLVVRLKLPVPGRVVPVLQAPKMDSSPTRTRKVIPPLTIMRTLYAGLGDGAKLLDYLPKDFVVGVGSSDAWKGYAPCRIEFGSVKDTKGFQTKIFAYLSNSARSRDLPEIHLRSRHNSRSGSNIFSFEEVMALRDLPAVFKPVKDLTSTPLKALTHCLFMLHGASYAADAILPKSFFTGLRDACHLYKIVAGRNNHDQSPDVAPKDAAGYGEADVSLQSRQTSVAPTRSPAPPVVIAPSARKRNFSTFQGSPQPPHQPSFPGTSPGRPAISPLTPPADVNSIRNPKVVTDTIHSASVLVSIRNPYYFELQKRAADVNIALKAANGMTLAQMGPQAHLTAPTDAIDAKRLEYKEADMKSLQTASKAEHEALKKRHMAEERALVERHVHEHEAARQGRPEVDLAFHQNGKAEFEKRQALLEEAVGIRGESDGVLRESLTSDWFARVHATIGDPTMAEQAEAGDDEAVE